MNLADCKHAVEGDPCWTFASIAHMGEGTGAFGTVDWQDPMMAVTAATMKKVDANAMAVFSWWKKRKKWMNG